MGFFRKENKEGAVAKKDLWSKDDEKYFFERYSQSGYNKPEYLFEQAYSLYTQNTPNDIMYDAVIRVLDRYISDFPDDKTIKAAALYLAGKVYHDRGNIDKMFEFFKKAADAEMEFPERIVGAGLDYAEQAVKCGRNEMFSDAERYIGHYFNDNIESPLLRYRVSAILTAIAEKKGDVDKHRYYKGRAETALNEIANIDKKLRYVKIIKLKNLDRSVIDRIKLFMIENEFELVDFDDTLMWRRKRIASFHNVFVETAFDVIVVIASVMFMQTAAGPWIEMGVDGFTAATTKRPLKKTIDDFERTFTVF
jgi:tetratricopeptide (TPR) repeat protein